MAYLLVAGVVLLRQKLHEHKELQREKKRLAYEERYRDLAHEHASRIGSHQQHVLAKPGSGHAETRHELSAVLSGNGQRRKSTDDGERRESGDIPARWADEVVKERTQMNVSQPCACK
ncbi:uncharacterized protein PV07_02859 [Cladophialophora immunda]|uniref:Uncharacterized protein n=1 Tax=Cladophialophora immunda TaxID=569365 RepID=A0A0D1ZSY0_9EURO|nr:uncharacterized protein PV07_02859 [Cladophialophora immunda]KIW31191.1 hypothetical protein PV07_02859 [Cladophialophora immunda]